MIKTEKDSSGIKLHSPVTGKITKEFIEHNNKRTDDYYWLNNPDDSSVINHLNDENNYVNAVMENTEEFQEKIYDELVSRTEQKFESLPVKKNGYWYYIRYDEGEQYPFNCRKKESMTSDEEIYLNEAELAKNHKVFILRGSAISPDNKWIAYGVDTSGDRRSAVYFKNIDDKRFSDEIINNTVGSYAWANDNRTFYYTLNDNTVRSYKVMKHILGTDPKSDIEIYTEADSTFAVYLETSKDNKYIFLSSSSFAATEYRYLNADNPDEKPVLIQSRQRDLLYYPRYYGDEIFYILNNKDAKNFKLSKTGISNTASENWEDVFPYNDSVFLENFEVTKNYIILQEKIKGLTQIKIADRRDNSEYYIDFGEEDYMSGMSMSTDEYDSDSIRLFYTSLTTPFTRYMYNLSTKEKLLLKQQKVGDDYDPSKYETKRIWARVTDGTMVPISLVYKKEKFKKDGSNPMLLYSYGSYGYNSESYFSSSAISLLDRGFSYAIAHIRGGQELGRQWYEDGKLMKKKNTFTDFVDCAQYLVNENYTSPDKLFANGESAGGMLMGAVVNMRPDLFRGIIAEVPWMDVVTDMLDSDLPLTTLEYDEWGDPNKKEYYDYMLSWSPYDNVKKADYPAILATGGLNDTQVPYYSPAKWVAKVRENNTGNNIILYKCNMNTGHGGDSGRFESLKLKALKYAFMFDLLGIKE